MGFKVEVYAEQKLRGEPVSSSHIRKLLVDGRASRARHLLARPFSILGTPGRGRGYGSKYTVPTINLARYEELIPFSHSSPPPVTIRASHGHQPPTTDSSGNAWAAPHAAGGVHGLGARRL